MPAIWTALSASVRGALHEKMDRPNQDAVRVYWAGETLFLAVADGHGNTRSFRSQQGAALATECALEALRDFMWRNGPDAPLSSVRRQMENRLPREIVKAWRRAVRADIARDPFSPLDFAAFPEKAPTLRPNEELPFSGYLAYGATLLVAAVTRRYLAFLQLGDGDILLVHADGQVSRPWSREHAFYSTQTASICNGDAPFLFKARVEPRRSEAPALIVLATDGYSNCFSDDTGFFTVGTDLLNYLRTGGTALVQEKLAPWLSESSRDGSGDDITVALAARLSKLLP
jgi:serine/threonine protein phosphatase PrpC